MKSDVVVIGSGISGLTCAALLAKKGKKVTLLEQNYLLGGALRRFKRQQIPFDVGFHYTGCLGEREILSALWDHCEVLAKLRITPFPEYGHDRLYIQGSGKMVQGYFSYERFQDELLSQFPAESKAITAYFSKVQEICAENPFYNLKLPLQAFLQGSRRRRPQSLLDFLHNLTTNQDLLSVFSAPSLLYGVPIRNASLEVHAMVAHGYYSGAYSVDGGGQAIVDSFIASLSSMGVEFGANRRVSKILVRENRTCGIELQDGQQIACEDVIFTGHPAAMLNIVPAGFFRAAYRKSLRYLKNSCTMFALFGKLPKGWNGVELNWVNHYSIPCGGDILPSATDTESAKRALMMTSPGIRDNVSPQTEQNGVILLQPARWQDVDVFKKSGKNARPTAYIKYKEIIGQEMLTNAAKIWGEQCLYIEPLAVGTPLTFHDELSSPEGGAYGAMHSIDQVTPGSRTNLPGFYLSGQSTLMTGIVGASLAGFVTAGEIVGLEPLWEEVRRCN